MSNDLLNFNIQFNQDKSSGGAIRNDMAKQPGGYTSVPQSSNQMQSPFGSYQPNSSQGYNPPGFDQGYGQHGGYAPAKLSEDSTMVGDEGDSLFDLSRASHPVAALFHLLFKGLTIICMINDEVMSFIITILFAAFDFWTVKNVSGRLLVGLRWWSEILPDGTEKWHFESHGQHVKLNPIDRRIFWWAQMIAVGFWALVGILNILRFNLFWGVASWICFMLTGTNYWGYHKCSKGKLNNFVSDQKQKITGFALTKLLGKGFNFFGGGRS